MIVSTRRIFSALSTIGLVGVSLLMAPKAQAMYQIQEMHTSSSSSVSCEGDSCNGKAEASSHSSGFQIQSSDGEVPEYVVRRWRRNRWYPSHRTTHHGHWRHR